MRTSLWALVEERAAASPDGEMMVDERGRRMWGTIMKLLDEVQEQGIEEAVEVLEMAEMVW